MNLTKKRNVTKLNVNVDTDIYNDFKILCKINFTDSSKSVRKFITNYVRDNQEILKEYFEEKKQLQKELQE